MPQHSMHLLNALLIVVALIPPFQVLAQRIGLVDIPHGRKVHEGAVPLTGGIVMFIAFALPMLSLDLPNGGLLLAGLCLLVIVGAIDDLGGLSPWTKLAAQVLAAAIMVVPGSLLIGPGALAGYPAPAASEAVAIAFTVFMIVGLTNAFNMIDGLDGLAGGAAAASLLGLAVAAGLSGNGDAELTLLVLLFAVVGFLAFNMRHRWRPRAAVFMGDAGSLLLGGAIAYFVVRLAAGEPEAAVPLPVLLWMVALPAFDTTILMARRLADGRSPVVGDRSHVHHLLLEAGATAQSATAILVAVSGALCATGILGWRLGLPPLAMLLGLLVPFCAHAYFVCHGWKLMARAREARSRRGAPEPIGPPIEDKAA